MNIEHRFPENASNWKFTDEGLPTHKYIEYQAWLRVRDWKDQNLDMIIAVIRQYPDLGEDVRNDPDRRHFKFPK